MNSFKRKVIDLKANKSDLDGNIKNVNTKMLILKIKTKDKIKKNVDESLITSSANLKNEFRYLMEDVDDS